MPNAKPSLRIALRATLLLALLLAIALPVQAQQLRAATMDELFSALATATGPGEANTIAAEIWRRWFSPEDEELARRMNEIVSARTAADLGATRQLLDRLIADYPDYAEGWNRRATLNYEVGRYADSLADIEETLKREPRHFGALSGRALVYLALGETALAREAAEAARAIHPYITASPPLNELAPPLVRT